MKQPKPAKNPKSNVIQFPMAKFGPDFCPEESVSHEHCWHVPAEDPQTVICCWCAEEREGGE